MAADAAGFEVTTAALTQHARSVDRIADAIDTAHDAGAHVRMGADAYGQLPVCQAIPFLLDFLQAPAVDALAAAQEALHSAAGRLTPPWTHTTTRTGRSPPPSGGCTDERDVANPLIAARQDTTTAYSGVGIVESLVDLRHGIESGSWIDTAIGGVGTSMEVLVTCVDPIGSIVSWGVAWLIEHVEPLSDALDWLAGDPDQITAYAQTWHNVSQHVNGQVTALSEAVRTEIAAWTGPASEAYRRYSDQHVRHLAGLADATDLIGTVVEGAGLLVALVRELVRDLIADFVSVLAVRLWQWLAEAGLTLGAATRWSRRRSPRWSPSGPRKSPGCSRRWPAASAGSGRSCPSSASCSTPSVRP
ncbi:hypothetical protein NKG94_31265 [Micromonospora sp. M12]